jgi:hypothetical protein
MRLISGVHFVRSAGLAAASTMFLLGSLGGCVHHVHSARAPSVHSRDHGPPPHAPAHGVRRQQHRDGVELAFDSGLGVHVVVNRPDYYWYTDRYLRWVAGEWSVSSRLDGHWAVVSIDAVPAGLVSKHSKHHKRAKHRGKHHWPAKHGY